MDVQPSLEYNPEEITVLNFAGMVLPSEEYSTAVVNFPGTNCNWYWGNTGHFYLSFNFYRNGKKVGRMNSGVIRENGYIELNFDTFFSFHDGNFDGIFLAEFYHSKDIPAEVYLSHIHKKTGSYISYPALAFTGDILYPEAHKTQLENTLFWPGVAADDATEVSVAVVNPYKLSFFYQASLFKENRSRAQTDTLKVKPYSVQIHKLEELFPDSYGDVLASRGQCSICVAAQYKLVAYMIFRNRRTGAITTIDHFHNYCLF